MRQFRRITTRRDLVDEDHIKIYDIAFENKTICTDEFLQRLTFVKNQKNKNWDSTPSFAIFHAGETRDYLILCWWDNGNELFTSVSVKEPQAWVEDNTKYSFCLYDLEVMWAERNFFIDCIDGAQPNLNRYRSCFYSQPN